MMVASTAEVTKLRLDWPRIGFVNRHAHIRLCNELYLKDDWHAKKWKAIDIQFDENFANKRLMTTIRQYSHPNYSMQDKNQDFVNTKCDLLTISHRLRKWSLLIIRNFVCLPPNRMRINHNIYTIKCWNTERFNATKRRWSSNWCNWIWSVRMHMRERQVRKNQCRQKTNVSSRSFRTAM